jgi:hypothetical protein
MEAYRFGITSYQDALVRPGILETYRAVYSAPSATPLPRVSLCLWWEPGQGLQQIEWMKRERERLTPNLRINTVKVMVDGVLETRTALSISLFFFHFFLFFLSYAISLSLFCTQHSEQPVLLLLWRNWTGELWRRRNETNV